MKIKSARQVWHDCTRINAGGSADALADLMILGRMVQKTDRGNTCDHAVHSAVAGRFQSAISKLHPQLRAFGNWMYSSIQSADEKEDAEEAVFNLAASKSARMTASKRERAEYVAKGVLHRYKRMHQGGQSSNPDPLEKPEAFRAWVLDVHGVQLSSVAWERDWQPFVRACFDACEDIDRMALSPIGAMIYAMKEAA